MYSGLTGKYHSNSETDPTPALSLKRPGLGGDDTVDTLQRYFGIFLLCLVLSLTVAHHAESQTLAVIHKVLAKSEKDSSSIIIKLSGNPACKVIGIGKREILIALKDSELSKGLFNKQITGDGLIQRVEINKRPNNVSCLLVKLHEPYIGIDHRIETGKGTLRVQITGKAGPSGVASTTASSKKTLKSSGSDSSLSHADTGAHVALSKACGVDQLLNPDSRDTTPDTDLFLQAAGRFQAGRWGETIRILGKIIKTYPKSPHLERAYFLLAKSYDRMFTKNISEHFLEVNRHYQDAISEFPNSVFVPDAMVSIGNCYFKVKNYYEALVYYRLVRENYEAYAAATEALFEQGRVFALTKKPKQAIGSFQQVEKLYPETPFASMAKIERAKALFDMNSFKRSLRLLDEVMTTEPNKVYEDPDVLLYSGYNYYELGRLGKARDLLCKVLNYYPDIESNHLILTRIADTYREQGFENKALELYNMVIRGYPDSEGGLISMLRLSADTQEVEFDPGVIEEIAPYNRPARETYKEVVKAHGDNPLSQLAGLRLALQQEKDKDYEGSINILRGILAKYPDTPLKEQIKSALRAPVEAIFEREQQGGNYARIVGYYEEVKNDLVVQDMPNLLLVLGDAYTRLHMYDRAISAFEKAKKSYPDQSQPPTLLLGLGESFYNVRRLEEAQRSLEGFVARYPEDKRAYHAYFLIGDIMLRQKEYTQAMAAFDLAMQKAPNGLYKIDILLAMAEASNWHRDYDKASRLLNRAIALMNQNKADSSSGTYEAYQELGETYLKLGKSKQALSAFENALKVSPKGRDDHSLRFRLAVCYQRLEKKDKTEGILNQIIASGDPFWSRLAETKINEMHVREAVEKLGYTWKTSQARIQSDDFYA
jgi:TolA-binding protein